MTISLNQITCENPYVCRRISMYLDNIEHYTNFNPFDKFRVFVNKDGDFTAFESTEESNHVQFTSNAHKLSETINSPIPPIEVSLSDFRNHIKEISKKHEVIT